jgi:hypothetical protein
MWLSALVRAPDDDPPVLAAADDEAALVAHSEGGDAAVVARLVPPHLPPLHQVPEAQQASPTAHHSPGVWCLGFISKGNISL